MESEQIPELYLFHSTGGNPARCIWICYCSEAVGQGRWRSSMYCGGIVCIRLYSATAGFYMNTVSVYRHIFPLPSSTQNVINTDDKRYGIILLKDTRTSMTSRYFLPNVQISCVVEADREVNRYMRNTGFFRRPAWYERWNCREYKWKVYFAFQVDKRIILKRNIESIRR